MDTREWSLIIFSVLVQMAVGAFLILGVVHWLAARKAGLDQADRLADKALLAIGPALVLAMFATLGHIGNPINAPRAVTNLANSWLSREIFAVVLFTVLGGIFAIMQWRKIGTPGLRNAIALITAAVGVFLVYSMARIYMLERQPAWNTVATPLQFFATTFLLGGLAVGAAFVANYAVVQRKEPGCAEVQCSLLRSSLRLIAMISVVMLGVELVVAPLLVSALAAGQEPAAVDSAALMFSQYGTAFALRLVLVFIGAGIIGLFLYRIASVEGRERLMGNLVYVAFALVLVSEVIGRFIFYAAHVGVGL